MNIFSFLLDPANWSGPGSIGQLLLQHLPFHFLVLIGHEDGFAGLALRADVLDTVDEAFNEREAAIGRKGTNAGKAG